MQIFGRPAAARDSKEPGGTKSHPKLSAGSRLGLTCGTRPRAARGRRKHTPSNATNSAANQNPAARFLLLRPCNNETVVLLRPCNNLVILWVTLSTDPWPIRLLSDSAALLERFARTIFRTKIDAAGNRRGPPCMSDNPTGRNYTGKR